MKKKIIAVAVACVAVAALALTGCAASGSNSANSGASNNTTTASSTSNTTTASGDVTERTVYVTPEWAKAAMNGEIKGYEDVVVACVDYGMDSKAVESYKTHIPGAIYVSNMEVEDATGDEAGAYNLLSAEEVAKYALSHGITADTKVILYGADAAGTGRQAYAYIWCGVKDVKIINGGIDAWTAAGYQTETNANTGTAATEFGCNVPAHPEYWVGIEEAKAKLASDKNFKLVSIRSEAEWLGQTSGYSYMDKAGEPEGAVWGKGAETAFDVALFQNADGTVKNLAGIQEVWKGCDFTLSNQLAFYCGTGWRATVPFLVLYENGYDNISVYDGGWYEWIMHKDYPVQVGDPASSTCEHTTVDKLPTGKAAK